MLFLRAGTSIRESVQISSEKARVPGNGCRHLQNTSLALFMSFSSPDKIIVASGILTATIPFLAVTCAHDPAIDALSKCRVTTRECQVAMPMPPQVALRERSAGSNARTL